jgi:hypothetical protein
VYGPPPLTTMPRSCASTYRKRHSLRNDADVERFWDSEGIYKCAVKPATGQPWTLIPIHVPVLDLKTSPYPCCMADKRLIAICKGLQCYSPYNIKVFCARLFCSGGQVYPSKKTLASIMYKIAGSSSFSVMHNNKIITMSEAYSVYWETTDLLLEELRMELTRAKVSLSWLANLKGAGHRGMHSTCDDYNHSTTVQTWLLLVLQSSYILWPHVAHLACCR